jgi:Histidine kinase-like ATPase domain
LLPPCGKRALPGRWGATLRLRARCSADPAQRQRRGGVWHPGPAAPGRRRPRPPVAWPRRRGAQPQPAGDPAADLRAAPAAAGHPVSGRRDQPAAQQGQRGGRRADRSPLARGRALDAALEATAFRAVEEALANVVQHANATRLLVTGQVADGLLAMEVVDDGSGFNPDTQPQALGDGHLGIHTMSEWIQPAGGSLQVRSAPAAGTTISINLPIRPRS